MVWLPTLPFDLSMLVVNESCVRARGGRFSDGNESLMGAGNPGLVVMVDLLFPCD
jgi:hypothetical protein